MAASDDSSAYLDKEFVRPEYIWKDGVCDVQAVHLSVQHLAKRLANIIPEAGAMKTIPETPVGMPNSAVPDAPQTDGRSSVTPSNTAVVPLQSNVWNGMEPINYHAQLKIGEDQKAFLMELDTGSSYLWVQSQLTASDPPTADQNFYVPSKSTTAHDLKNSCLIRYGDGSSVKASLFTDMVSVGALTTADQIIAAAASYDINDKFRKKSSNGLLGLGFSLSTTSAVVSESIKPQNLVLALLASGRIKYASLTIVGPRNDPKLAAVIDKEAIMQPRGFFVIGSVDPKFYTGSISWCPQIVRDRWIVTLDEVIINGVTVCRDQKALIDTGTAYIVASPSNYNKVFSSIPGAKRHKQDQETYIAYPEGNLKSISLDFGGRTFDMFPQDFSLGGVSLVSQKAASSVIPGAGEPLTTFKLASIIRTEPWLFDEDVWIIGGIFLDNIVTIFDFGKQQIGFATINPDDPQDEFMNK